MTEVSSCINTFGCMFKQGAAEHVLRNHYNMLDIVLEFLYWASLPTEYTDPFKNLLFTATNAHSNYSAIQVLWSSLKLSLQRVNETHIDSKHFMT